MLEKQIAYRVEQLRECANSIIKNAESIIGNEDIQGDTEITIHLNNNERPRINIYRDFYPEDRNNNKDFLDRYMNNNKGVNVK